MKKALSLLLAVCLCMGLVIPSFADQENSETVARLIVSAKEKLGISDDEFVFTNYYQNETEDGNRYNLNWESKDDTKSSNISVEMSEAGTIFRYHRYDSAKESGQPKYPARSQEEALAEAKAVFARIDAEKAAQVSDEEIVYNSYDNSYAYEAQRVHNGVPVFDNNVSLQLDADSLQLSSYYANWEERLTFADAEAISQDEARAAFAEKIGYELFYQVVSEDYKDTVKLVYRPKFDEGLYIDAVSGEAVDFEMVYEAMSGGAGAKNEATMDAAAARLSPEEQAMVDEISQMLPKEKAEQIARGVSEFGISSDYKVENYNISKNASGKYIGRISFRTGSAKEENYGYRNVSIDAKTGEVIAYNGYSYLDERSVNSNSGDKTEISAEESREIAEKFLNKYYADKFAKMEAKSVFNPTGGSVNYQRVENGVKVYNNGAYVYIDSESKEIRSFSLTWTDAAFPAADAAELEQVYDKVLAEDNFRCGYLMVPGENGKKPAAQLVYRLENEMTLDASSLEELDWRLRPVSISQKPEYVDLEGHYAKEYVEKLLQMGIYLPNEAEGGSKASSLRPDAGVTQKDYLQLIAQVVFNRSAVYDDNDFYNDLVRRGVLAKEDIRPDSTVTRIEAIRYLLNALGYKEFVAIPGIFNCPFADVAEADKGYGAVAAGLRLVNSDTDTFYADSALRRGDALIIIYNYLNR